MDADFLDWAMADFSGYVAIDELYDGPFCVLSMVDNRTFKRLLYQVLDHDPDHTDITAFLRRFQTVLTQRGLTLKGVTTDGSALYPEPLRAVFGDVPHQICEFHVIKELTKAILRAVAKVRKKLAARKPADIDAVVLSHAHIDHCGNLPNLVRQGFDGPIFCTPATRSLLSIMLADSARIQQEEAKVDKIIGRADESTTGLLYSHREVERTLQQCVTVPYDQPRAL